MRFYEKTNRFMVLGIILTIGFGCKFFQLKEPAETVEEPKKTVITKDALKESLAAKGIKMAKIAPEKPNPLTLKLKFSNRNNDYLINQEYLETFGALANLLNQVFRERESYGVFIEGTNEIYKKITLSAYQKTIDEYNSKNIFIEDFEKLVDDLRKAGFDQIELDINEENSDLIPNAPKKLSLETRRRLLDDEPTEPKKSADIKTISGGILNGKAVELLKPAYPPAARAVRASGAVNVQVTVDENGDVISASAVSGHPLLRQAAVSAAKNAKFNPTLLSGRAVKVTGVIVFNFTP